MGDKLSKIALAVSIGALSVALLRLLLQIL